MSSVLRPVRKRKKSRTLGPVDVIRREDYGDLELDAKVELIRSLVPLGLMHVKEMLDEEVMALAGARYARKDASIGGRRHGSNPGTVGLAGQRVPIRVRVARNGSTYTSALASIGPPSSVRPSPAAEVRPQHERPNSENGGVKLDHPLPCAHRPRQRCDPSTNGRTLRTAE